MAIHGSGAVSLAHAIGGYTLPGSETTLQGNRIRSRNIECSVADLMALLREVGEVLGVTSEYNVVLGIEWTGDGPLIIEANDVHEPRSTNAPIPLARHTKIRFGVT